MSYANGTSFLNLPQTVGTDKRDWFDTNEAFLDLDAKVKAAYEGEIDTAAALAALSETVSDLSTTVSGLNTTVGQHTTSIATINEALTLINTALTSLNTSVNSKFDSAGIADVYDAEHGTYSVDDVVTYNGQRYVCHTAVTAAEPFDADKWTAEDVQTVLDNISGDISDINTALSEIGTLIESRNSSDTTISTHGSWIDTVSITLSAGKWLLIGNAIANNSSDELVYTITIDKLRNNVRQTTRNDDINNAYPSANICTFISISNDTTYTLQVGVNGIADPTFGSGHLLIQGIKLN